MGKAGLGEKHHMMKAEMGWKSRVTLSSLWTWDRLSGHSAPSSSLELLSRGKQVSFRQASSPHLREGLQGSDTEKQADTGVGMLSCYTM